MDVRLYCIEMTIVAYLWNAATVKMENCTLGDLKGKCDKLIVTNGQACYYTDSLSTKIIHARISCDSMYTIDKALFSCELTGNNKNWIPSTPAVCSLKTLTSTSLYTSEVLSPEKTLLSTVKTSVSTSSLAGLVPSEVLSSENTLPSTGTPILTTYTMISQTKIMASSSDVQIEPSSINPSTISSGISIIISSTKNASAGLVTPGPTASRKVNDSDLKAVYIAVPVIICVIVLLVVVILWWRRNTHRPSASLVKRGPGSLITNQLYGTNGIDRSCSLLTVRQSTVNEYAEIPLDIINPGETVGDNYQTIDILPEEKDGGKNSYNNCKLSETEFSDSNYSHIGSNNTRNNASSDNMYAHTQLNNVPQKSEVSLPNDCDDTYNKLHTATLSARRRQEIEYTETEYNHASAGGWYPQNERGDTYSHLNGNMQIPGVSYKKPNQYEDGGKNIESTNLQLSAKDLPSNTSYVFAKELSAKDLSSSTGYEFAKELTAKELPSNTGYAFAKDLDNLNNSSGTPEYAKVTKNNSAISKGYETAVGTTHNYLVLEPEINPAPTAALFNVIEDVPAESEDTDEARTGHEYFTLEKS